MQNNPKRILMLAPRCEPITSMESRLAWYRAVTASAEFDTTMICGSESRPYVEQYVQKSGKPVPFAIQYVPGSDWDKLSSIPGLFYLAYHQWHKRAFTLACDLHQQTPFDLVHQVGFCGYREPSYLWRMDVPFIWGPIGGTQDFPNQFLSMLAPSSACYEVSRSVLNLLHMRFRSRVHAAAQKSVKVFAANSCGVNDFDRVFGMRPELQLETGIPQLPSVVAKPSDASRPLRILWAGRLKPWKAIPLLLRALEGLYDRQPFELRVIGHADQARPYQRLAKRLGIDRHIAWLGWPNYDETFPHYEWADVFAFTSLRDTSGTGLLEALAHGCPIIGVDHQGAHDIMTVDSAVPIRVESPQQVIADFRAALCRLGKDRAELTRLSQGALRRAADFTWERLGARMRESYREVLAERQRVEMTSNDPPPSHQCAMDV